MPAIDKRTAHIIAHQIEEGRLPIGYAKSLSEADKRIVEEAMTDHTHGLDEYRHSREE